MTFIFLSVNRPGMVYFFSGKLTNCREGECMHGEKQYLSYPFLYEKKNVVDFELLTDEITSLLGQSIAICTDVDLKEELIQVASLVYHLNPCVRSKTELAQEELRWLFKRYTHYMKLTKSRESYFVLPTGGQLGSSLHIVRTKAKQLVRLLHQLSEEGIEFYDSLFDFSNVLANYAFTAAMYANQLEGIKEIPFESRVYK